MRPMKPQPRIPTFTGMSHPWTTWLVTR